MSDRVKLPYLSDENWLKLESSLARFGSLSETIENQLDSPFDLGTVIAELESSYKESGYQYLFYGLVRLLKPEKIIEIGVLQGFSLLAMASALKVNGRGAIKGYDLFDEYEYKNDRMTNVLSRVNSTNLHPFASLRKCDAYKVCKIERQADILHVDISNNGDSVGELFGQWNTRISDLIVFEGGHSDRDSIEWMRKYDKAPIHTALVRLADLFSKDWKFITLSPFPSITLCIKKDD